VIPDGTYRAIVDRLERGRAVLEVHEPDDSLSELTVDVTRLPPEGRQPDAVLDVTVADGALRTLTYDASATGERRDRAQRRFDDLAERPPDSDDE